MKTENELRKLKRVDLLEMLLEQSQELERVKAQLEQAESELRSRKILLDNAGSIAEAAMQLNDIFTVAQKPPTNIWRISGVYTRKAKRRPSKRLSKRAGVCQLVSDN